MLANANAGRIHVVMQVGLDLADDGVSSIEDLDDLLKRWATVVGLLALSHRGRYRSLTYRVST